MRTLTKYAAAAVLAGALAVLAATPGEARSYRHHGAAVTKGAVDQRSGDANGAAYGSYAYAPLGPDAASSVESRCMLSPSSINFVPCNNR